MLDPHRDVSPAAFSLARREIARRDMVIGGAFLIGRSAVGPDDTDQAGARRMAAFVLSRHPATGALRVCHLITIAYSGAGFRLPGLVLGFCLGFRPWV
jgi:hypothetical protein